jgi:hypothetical protein
MILKGVSFSIDKCIINNLRQFCVRFNVLTILIPSKNTIYTGNSSHTKKHGFFHVIYSIHSINKIKTRLHYGLKDLYYQDKIEIRRVQELQDG